MSKKQTHNKSKNPKQLNKYIRFSGIALQMAVIILSGSLFGKYIDNKYSYDRIFTVFFSLLSVIFSLYFFYIKARNTK
ncbi:MAG: hypothetical protein CMP51_02425 [Flavobacteriales bacterium]|nr:hypothetical protein [Flavobacteriales bacterium]